MTEIDKLKLIREQFDLYPVRKEPFSFKVAGFFTVSAHYTEEHFWLLQTVDGISGYKSTSKVMNHKIDDYLMVMFARRCIYWLENWRDR